MVMPKSLISLTVAGGNPFRWYSLFVGMFSLEIFKVLYLVCRDTLPKYHSKLRAVLGIVEVKIYPKAFQLS